MLNGLLAPLLDNLAEHGAEAQRRFPAEWVAKTATSLALKFLIGKALEAGIPDGYAEKFGLSDDQAKKIYEATLTGALTRV